MKKLLAILCSVVMLFAFVACTNPNKGKMPTKDQWSKVGISGGFDANVKGTLELSNVSEKGEISMKWSGSDESSLDNTITWLKTQGYTSHNGQTAQKTTEEGGKIISYMAEKTVSKTANASLRLLADNLLGDQNAVVAETFYITEDFSIMGVNFKAGELYLDIYEKQGMSINPGMYNQWPTAQIQGAIGESIPEYAGTSSGFQFIDSSLGIFKNAQVVVYGATEQDATAYKTLLTQNGFVESDDSFVKILANGNSLSVMVYASQSYHPETFQIVEVINITVMMEKNSGEYTSWSALNLSVFDGAGLPTYNGGTSFDISDIGAETIKTQLDTIQSSIDMLEAFESMLGEEEKAELAKLRAQLPLYEKLESYMITVYGTTQDQANEWEDALESAGFNYGEKFYGDYYIIAEIDFYDGKATITLLRMPKELKEEDVQDGGNQGQQSTDLSFDDLPSNVKIRFESLSMIYNVTKIGNDYLIETEGVYTYLKYDGTKWAQYRKIGETGEWLQIDDVNDLSNMLVMFYLEDLFDNSVSNLTNSGTEQILGKTCTVYSNSETFYGVTTSETKKITQEGFVFEYFVSMDMDGQSYSSADFKVLLWDTSITSFEITLPI